MRIKTKTAICLFGFFVLPLLLCGTAGGTDNKTGLIAGIFTPKDRQPPLITLEEPETTKIVFMEKIYLEGHVTDETGVADLMINQVSLPVPKKRDVSFSYIAQLKKGKNSLTIQARDKAGNLSEKILIILRRDASPVQLTERLSLAVLPFTYKSDILEPDPAFQENLISALIRQNRFRMIERNALDAVLQEQKISSTRLFDPQTASQMGRLAAAQSVITGTCIRRDKGIEIEARIIDSETSEVLSLQTVSHKGSDPFDIQYLAEGLALKFHRDFPLVGGFVIEKKEQEIQIDLGQNVLEPGRRLIIFREEKITHPATGKVLGMDHHIIARARVTKVMAETSLARLYGNPGETIRPLDRVITQ